MSETINKGQTAGQEPAIKPREAAGTIEVNEVELKQPEKTSAQDLGELITALDEEYKILEKRFEIEGLDTTNTTDQDNTDLSKSKGLSADASLKELRVFIDDLKEINNIKLGDKSETLLQRTKELESLCELLNTDAEQLEYDLSVEDSEFSKRILEFSISFIELMRDKSMQILGKMETELMGELTKKRGVDEKTKTVE